MPDFAIYFTLSPDELNLIFNETLALDDQIASKLRLGVAKKDGIHLSLLPPDFDDLMDGLAADLNQRVKFECPQFLCQLSQLH